jgi:hypothetical protein
MLDLARAVREQVVKEMPPRKAKTPRPITAAGLRRLAIWGGTAAGALLLAVISGDSEVGAHRLVLAFHGDQTQQFDAEAETRQLADAVRGLAADGEQMKTRLAGVEQDMNDVTGSVSKEIEAADAAHRLDNGPTVSATAHLTVATLPASANAAVPGSPYAEYGVDIGSGLTIQALRARWETLRSAHPLLFERLQPIVSVKEVPGANRVELRLVAGPIAQPGTATQLCASLSLFGLFCQPTIYDGQHLALR